MSYIIRYDSRDPKHLHPQKQLELDGMKAIKAQPETIADCWFFEVEELVDPLPEWYTLTPGYKFYE